MTRCSNHWFQKSLDAIVSIERESVTEGVAAAVVAMGQALGFTSVVIAKFPGPGESVNSNVLVNNRPTYFTADYFAGGFDDVDPLLIEILQNRQPLLWRDVYAQPLTSRQKALDQLTRDAGIRDGLAVPLYHRVFAGIASFSASDRLECPDDQKALTLAATYAFSKLLKLREPLSTTLLNPRERECLTWAAVGKNESEISDIIGI